MTRVRWSARADADFVALIAYLREHHRPAAVRASTDIKRLSRYLRRHPELGHAGRETGTRELSIPVWKQVLVYRLDDEGVEIITLRDTRMNPEED